MNELNFPAFPFSRQSRVGMDGRLIAPSVMHASSISTPLPTTPPRSQPFAPSATSSSSATTTRPTTTGSSLSLLDQTIADREARLQRAAEQREQFKRRVEQMAAAEQHVKEITTPAPGRQSFLTRLTSSDTIAKANHTLSPQSAALTPPEDEKSPMVVGLTRFAYLPKSSSNQQHSGDESTDGAARSYFRDKVSVGSNPVSASNAPPKPTHQSSILRFVSPSKKSAATPTFTTSPSAHLQVGEAIVRDNDDLLLGDMSSNESWRTVKLATTAAIPTQKKPAVKRRIDIDDDGDDDGATSIRPAPKITRKAVSSASTKKSLSHHVTHSTASLAPFAEIETMSSAACGSAITELYEARFGFIC